MVSGWDDLALISSDYKIVLPLGQFDFALRSRVTTRTDSAVSAPEEVLSRDRARVLGLLHEMGRFSASNG